MSEIDEETVERVARALADCALEPFDKLSMRKFMADARAAIAAMSSWRPIESAPKSRDDLIDIWCISPREDEPGTTRLTDVFWYVADEISPHTGWARITDEGGLDFVEMEATSDYGLPPWKPTHWMPLSPPPKLEGGQT